MPRAPFAGACDPSGHSINAIAVTSAIGDQGMIFQNARTKVNRAINIIRAFLYPMGEDSRWQEISIDGDYRLLRTFGFFDYAKQRGGIAYVKSLYGSIVGGLEPFDIRRHLPFMNLLGFNEILEIARNTDNFSKRLVKAADWLGEATKPDILQTKFVKVAFSIDSMIGAEEQDIPDKGKRARIAERAAFLLGTSYRIRIWMFNKFSKIIQKRDAIAHGSTMLITEADVEEAGKYARILLRRLLVEQPKFTSIQQLATWVKKQSLSG